MDNKFNERINNIFLEVLHLPDDRIPDQVLRTEIEVWDSLSHILLVDSLGKEFAVKIPPELALEMESLGDIKRIMKDLVNSD